MDDTQKKALILEYFNTFDTGGTRSNGEGILSLFADDARVWFPKWGLAVGTDQIGKMFGDLASNFKGINHYTSQLNFIFSGGSMVAVEGITSGEHRDGIWRAGEPEWGAGRWCDIFEIWDGKIQRLFIYLDPDYASLDTERYPWLEGQKGPNAA
jgi:ketosteroid isomerase-like protein